MSGRLIALYGVNNLGKSTQVDLLVEALTGNGRAVMQRKSPNYDLPSGRVINAILREGREVTSIEQQLWFAVNMNQEQTAISEAIMVGSDVVMEDYWGTTMAWGLGHGVTRADLDAALDGLRSPDLAILLHGQRFDQAKEAGHLHEQNDELTERVQELHLQLADEFGWHKVNANQSIDEVHAEIMKIVGAE